MESHPHDKDRHMLHALGYAQELSRRMSGFSNFAISFTIISILSGTLTLYYQGINYGGPVEEAYGWPIVSVFVVIVGLGMAEIASKYPTAGGLYYWASKMGGARLGLVHRLVQPDRPDRDHGRHRLRRGGLRGRAAAAALGRHVQRHASTRSIYVYAVHPRAACGDEHLQRPARRAPERRLGLVARASGVLIIVGFLIFKPDHHQSFGTVFGQTVNNSGFSHGWLWFVLLLGLLQAQYTYTGYDASAHMSEETQGRVTIRGARRRSCRSSSRRSSVTSWRSA